MIVANYKKLKNYKAFVEINKFQLQKYKRNRFFWEIVDSTKKSLLSVLQIFFNPMLLIATSITVVFTSMLLHLHFVPYKRKFQ